jgi:hypothetical protein
VVFIQMELLDEPTCETASGLSQSLGCWDIGRYPAGDFLEDVVVEICVADPGEEVMTDYEYYVAQRLHKQDEGTQEITALPLVNSGLDCSGFPWAEGPEQMAAADGGPSFFGTVGSTLADLFLPDPLGAYLREVRRPPRGLGGMVGSFTWFFGAVPEEPAYERVPVGSGPAVSWTVEAEEDVELCNAEGGVGCPDGSVTEVEVAAVAQGTTADDGPPWWRVYLFYRPSDESAPPTLIGLADYDGYTDNESERYYRWTANLQGDGLPEGLVDIYAVGVRHPSDGGEIFGTGLVSYITVVPPPSSWSLTGVWIGTYTWECTPAYSGSTPIQFDLTDNGDATVDGVVSYLGGSATIPTWGGVRLRDVTLDQYGFVSAGTIDPTGDFVTIKHYGSAQFVNNWFNGWLDGSGQSISGIAINGDSPPGVGCSAATTTTGTFTVERVSSLVSQVLTAKASATGLSAVQNPTAPSRSSGSSPWKGGTR